MPTMYFITRVRGTNGEMPAAQGAQERQHQSCVLGVMEGSTGRGQAVPGVWAELGPSLFL